MQLSHDEVISLHLACSLAIADIKAKQAPANYIYTSLAHLKRLKERCEKEYPELG